MAFVAPPTWSKDEILAACERSCSDFSLSRRTEGIDYYVIAFDSAAVKVDALIEDTDDLQALSAKAPQLFSEGRLQEVRYLSSPAISEDDLKTLSGVGSTSKAALSDDATARRAMEVIEENLDPKRFPWVDEGRPPTTEERQTAIVSTAALIAGQETQTKRRNLAKENQESAVARFLEDEGYCEVPRRHIVTLSDAPAPKEYCRECMVSGKKADIVVGLADGRFMALECKVSNSEVNSFKRLNHETVEKIAHWATAFGTSGVVGAAVLAGVFKPQNVFDAQSEGVSIFWSYDLRPLGGFLASVEESR